MYQARPNARPSEQMPDWDLHDAIWTPSARWNRPHWMAEPPPALLPHSVDRSRWCMDVIGWSPSQLALRLYCNHDVIRQMLRGYRVMADNLAVFLEYRVAVTMSAYSGEFDRAEDAAWVPPAGWTPPPWLRPEPCPAFLAYKAI